MSRDLLRFADERVTYFPGFPISQFSQGYQGAHTSCAPEWEIAGEQDGSAEGHGYRDKADGIKGWNRNDVIGYRADGRKRRQQPQDRSYPCGSDSIGISRSICEMSPLT